LLMGRSVGKQRLRVSHVQTAASSACEEKELGVDSSKFRREQIPWADH
jgi:hypothetical protein